MLKEIPPGEAARMLEAGEAVLVDVREAQEFARVRVPGAHNVPLSGLAGAQLPGAGAVLFHCRTGARTRLQADALAAKAEGRPAFVVAGGLHAWHDAGHPVEGDARIGPNLPLLALSILALIGALVLLALR